MAGEKPASTVRVKLTVSDVDVELECGIDEVGDVVGRVLDALAERGVTASRVTGPGEKPTVIGRGETCKSLIMGLWREGWLSIGRSLGEVHTEMGRRGFHYDRTAVAHALVDLVREGILTRVGKPRRYKYLQKRPSPAAAKPEESKEAE